MRRPCLLALALAASACAAEPRPEPVEARSPAPLPEPARALPAPDITISVLGLNDLHGRLVALPVFAGYVNNVRAARGRDGGGVVVVDAGDMFQGSLESNLTEGGSVIAAYQALGMSAVALGNHEFDFGPVGPDHAAEGDPQGAIKARIAGAGFPVLAANLVDERTQERARWAGLEASTVIDVAGIPLGVVGALTTSTPDIVMPAFFAGLDATPVAPVIAQEARALRERGARAVLGVLHLGAECQRFDDPRDLSSCSDDDEVFQVLRALPERSVDAVFAGHTHAGVAHFVGEVPVVEAYARGRAFSRVDLIFDGSTKTLEKAVPYPPTDLCPDLQAEQCSAGQYEGAPVVPDERVARAIAPAFELARSRRAQPVGPVLTAEVTRSHGQESALGNLFADLMLELAPGADAAIVNGGSLRADLPAGPLAYGALYEAMPFDNRVARVTLTGSELTRVLETHLSHAAHGIVSVAGLRVEAMCAHGKLEVALFRSTGRRVKPDEMLSVVTSDYLATGGDRLFAPAALPPERRKPDLGAGLRDAMAERLAQRSAVDPAKLLDPKKPRLRLPSARPIGCAGE